MYNDLNTGTKANINEEYPKSFIYEVPYLKELFLASNRAADAALNMARFELYRQKRARLEKQGIFRETHPEEYKRMADLVMNETGRGKLLSFLENSKAAQLMGQTFYGTRLMAARFNILNPKNYLDMKSLNPLSDKKLSEYDAVKKEALKDMVGFTTGLVVLGLSAKASGAGVSFNPDDPDFLQVRFGKKVYDITGGLSPYVRTSLRIMEAAVARGQSELGMGSSKKADKKANFAWTSTTRFFRNKLAPNTSNFVNMFYGKNTIGEPFSYSDFIRLYPLYVEDTYKAIQEDGISALATVLVPNLLGLGYGSYANKANKEVGKASGVDKTNINNTQNNSRETKSTPTKVGQYKGY